MFMFLKQTLSSSFKFIYYEDALWIMKLKYYHLLFWENSKIPGFFNTNMTSLEFSLFFSSIKIFSAEFVFIIPF
jgi:hypothetical protein